MSLHASTETPSKVVEQEEYEKLVKGYEALKVENDLLSGKIRGYMTLSDIVKDYKKEQKKLKEEIRHLKQQLTSTSSSETELKNMESHASYDEISHLSKSSVAERSVGRPPPNSFTPESSLIVQSRHGVREVIPMQESMTEDQFENTALKMNSLNIHSSVASNQEVRSKETPLITSKSNFESIYLDETSKLRNELRDLQKKYLAQTAEVEKLRHELEMQRQSKENGDWVTVEKSNGRLDMKQENIDVSVPQLQDKIRQLNDANQQWVDSWKKNQEAYDKRIQDLQKELGRVTAENTEFRIQDEKRRKELDEMVLSSKKKCQDEEAAKEDALLQLKQTLDRLDSQKAKFHELEDKYNIVNRDYSAAKAELAVLRQTPASAVSSAYQGTASRDTRGKSQQELQTEIDVLHQQIVVFKEDFDRERNDRARAQSSKEEYKKQLEVSKRRAKNFEQKSITAERQLSGVQENLNRTLKENERLQQELVQVKNELRKEKEANAYPPMMMPAGYGMQHAMPIVQSAGIHPQQYAVPMQQYMGPPMAQYTPAFMPAVQPQVAQAHSQRRPMPTASPYYQAHPVHNPPELLPGSWSCASCTFVNYPGRTVCEMCGYINKPGQRTVAGSGQTSGTLIPRGDEDQNINQYNVIDTN